MYCLVQLYVPIAKHLAHHKPLLKLLAVKAIGMRLDLFCTLLRLNLPLGN
jgi:Organic solute transporter Ostalpha